MNGSDVYLDREMRGGKQIEGGRVDSLCWSEVNVSYIYDHCPSGDAGGL